MNKFSLLLDLPVYNDEEENTVARTVNVLNLIVIAGLLILSLQRLFFDGGRFVPEISMVIIFLIGSNILLRRGLINIAAALIIWPLFGLITYLLWHNNGLHDTVLFGIPGLLVIAGLVFKRAYFYFFAIICTLTIILLGAFELAGIVKNEFSSKTDIFDIVDIVIIIGITAAGIRVFLERLKRGFNLTLQNQKEKLESEQQNRALIAALPDMVLRISSDGIFRNFISSNSFEQIYSNEEVIGKNIKELFSEEIAAKTVEAINKAIDKESIEQFEYSLFDGKTLSTYEARIVALNREEAIAVIRDISERKRTEEALKQSEEIFKAFMEHSPVYVFFKDKDTRSLRLSRNYENMLHMPLEKLLGKTMFELFPSDLAKSMTEDDLKIIREGKVVRAVEEHEGKIYETIKFPITIDGTNKFLAGFTLDISSTKKYEKELRKYAEELREANNSKEKFFSIIAHDLRSPFQGIMGAVQMLTSDYATFTDDERKMLIERIDSAIRKTFELLENLLNWSRMQSGKIEPNLVKLNLFKEVNSVSLLLKDFARNKNLELELDIDEKYMINADIDMFRTVVRNLISNGIKFSVPGGKVTVTAEEEEKYVVIKVSDKGIGMDAETMDNLFKIEKTTSRLGTMNESGTGIGLLVCKEMIELNKGKIRVESREREGSEFYLYMPRA